jgi:tetratricopeptide (TPR) repeat protein
MQGEWIQQPTAGRAVVFVHGIFASKAGSWRHSNGAYWPALTAATPGHESIGVYVFTYQTDFFCGTYRLGNAVDALKEHLRLDSVLDCSEIVFVCHSMGGIVVRKYLVERAQDLIENNTEIGLFLIASPSLGATYANWLHGLAQLMNHSQAMALRFGQHNAWLRDLDKEFQNLKEGGRLRMRGKELAEDKFVVLRRFWRKPVVEEFSATRYFGEPYKVPGSDHFSIATPPDKDATQHRLLCRFIADKETATPVRRTLATAPGAGNVPRCVNVVPFLAPSHFKDREEVTSKLASLIRNEETRVIWLVGRGGIGKTSIACRLLKSLERGLFPDDLGRFPVRGIVYLSEAGTHRISASNVFLDLCKVLDPQSAERFKALFKDSNVSTRGKIQTLLAEFPDGATLLLLDNFEVLLDPVSCEVTDGELDEALRAVVDAAHHAVTILVTTRIPPRNLLQFHGERQARVDLTKGLTSPYAEDVLRAMDRDGSLGLRDAPADLLNNARKRTQGHPRALEAFCGALSADRSEDLQEVLDALPANVEDALAEPFKRLDPAAQQVIQALAVYASPVDPSAIDYLLQPYGAGAGSSDSVLKRLVNIHLARKEGRRRFYLHSDDVTYALSLIPVGEPCDRDSMPPRFSRMALWSRGADYLRQARPSGSPKCLADTASFEREFELRMLSSDYDRAVDTLVEIDRKVLMPLGATRDAVAMHERLRGKPMAPARRQRHCGHLGALYRALGRTDEAIECLNEAVTLAREQGDRPGEADSVNQLGQCNRAKGLLDDAVVCHQKAAELFGEHDDAWSMNQRGGAHAYLGTCFKALGRIDEAIRYIRDALAISRRTRDVKSQAANLSLLGTCYEDMGRIDRAMRLHQRAVNIARDPTDPDHTNEGFYLGNLSVCKSDVGQLEEALALATLAFESSRKVGALRSECIGLRRRATLQLLLGHADEAERDLAEALRIARAISYRLGEAEALSRLAEVLTDSGRSRDADVAAAQSVELSRNMKVRTFITSRVALSRRRLTRGDVAGARRLLQDAAGLDSAMHPPTLHELLGIAALRGGDTSMALQAFEQTVSLVEPLLARTPNLYRQQEMRGVAHVGLFLCGRSEAAPLALSSFKQARASTMAPGAVRSILRTIDFLVEKSRPDALDQFRNAAAGAPISDEE